jgi:hypothetical protein
MRPPETQRRPGQGAALITGNEVTANHSAPVAYVKRVTVLRLIGRIVPMMGAPLRALFCCGRRACA